MSYQPKPGTRIDILLQAMRESASTRPIWTQDQAAKAMDVARSLVPNYIAAACNGKALYRRTLQGGIELSLQPFAEAPAPAREPFIPFVAPVPRPGSDVRLPSGTAPKLCLGCSKAACWDNGCQDPAKAAPAPTPAPTPAPVPVGVVELNVPVFVSGETPAVVAEEPGNAPVTFPKPSADWGTVTHIGIGDGAAATEEDEEAPAFDCFVSLVTGAMQIIGAEIDEEGRVHLTREQAALIREKTAWGPPA